MEEEYEAVRVKRKRGLCRRKQRETIRKDEDRYLISIINCCDDTGLLISVALSSNYPGSYKELRKIKNKTTKKKKWRRRQRYENPIKHIREVLWICTRAYIDMYTRFVSRASPFTQRLFCVCVCVWRTRAPTYMCMYARACVYVCAYACVRDEEWMVFHGVRAALRVFFSLCVRALVGMLVRVCA